MFYYAFKCNIFVIIKLFSDFKKYLTLYFNRLNKSSSQLKMAKGTKIKIVKFSGQLVPSAAHK